MSLVVAAHNANEIVFAWDSLSRSTKTGVSAPDSSVEKVRRVNPRLAYMITGAYASDKLQFLSDYARSVRSTTALDPAFWSLYRLAGNRMTVYPPEGFRLGVAGFNDGVPGFKCITVVYGHEIVAQGSTDNYYVSGEREPVELAESRITASAILRQPSTDKIRRTLSTIVQECIDTYPQTLGGPVQTLVLTHA